MTETNEILGYKIFTVISLFVSIFSLMLAFSALRGEEIDITPLEEQINSISDIQKSQAISIDSLKGIEKDVTSAKAELAVLKSDVSKLKPTSLTDIKSLKEDIDDLDDEVDNLEDCIADSDDLDELDDCVN